MRCPFLGDYRSEARKNPTNGEVGREQLTFFPRFARSL